MGWVMNWLSGIILCLNEIFKNQKRSGFGKCSLSARCSNPGMEVKKEDRQNYETEGDRCRRDVGKVELRKR